MSGTIIDYRPHSTPTNRPSVPPAVPTPTRFPPSRDNRPTSTSPPKLAATTQSTPARVAPLPPKTASPPKLGGSPRPTPPRRPASPSALPPQSVNSSTHNYTPTERLVKTPSKPPPPPSHLPAKVINHTRPTSDHQDEGLQSSSSPTKLGYSNPKESNTAPPTPMGPADPFEASLTHRLAVHIVRPAAPTSRPQTMSPTRDARASASPRPPGPPMIASILRAPNQLGTPVAHLPPTPLAAQSKSPHRGEKSPMLMPPSVAPPPPPGGLPSERKLQIGLEGPSTVVRHSLGSPGAIKHAWGPGPEQKPVHQRVISTASNASTATVFLVPTPKNSSNNLQHQSASSDIPTTVAPKVPTSRPTSTANRSSSSRAGSPQSRADEAQLSAPRGRPVPPTVQTENNSFSIRSELNDALTKADGMSPKPSPSPPRGRASPVAFVEVGDGRPETLVFQRNPLNESTNGLKSGTPKAKRRSAAVATPLGSTSTMLERAATDRVATTTTPLEGAILASSGLKSIVIIVQERHLIDAGASGSPSPAKDVPSPQLFTILFPEPSSSTSHGNWKAMTVGELKELVTGEYLSHLMKDRPQDGPRTEPTALGRFIFERKGAAEQKRHVLACVGVADTSASQLQYARSPLASVAATVLPSVGSVVSSQLLRDGIPLSDTHSLGQHDYRLGQHEVLMLQIYRVADSRAGITGNNVSPTPTAGGHRRLLPSANKTIQQASASPSLGLAFDRKPLRRTATNSRPSVEHALEHINYPTPGRHQSPSASRFASSAYATPVRAEGRQRVLVSPDPYDQS